MAQSKAIAGWLAASVLLGGAAALPARAADDLDRLLKEVNPPARFKDYQGRFSVRKVQFKWTAFRRATGRTVEISDEKQTLFDGDRMIGYIYDRNPVFAQLRLFSMHPGHVAKIDPSDWADATDFRNYARDYGEAIMFGSVYDETRTEVRGGGATITFVRTDVGRPGGRAKRDVREVNTIVLSVHPQLGYCLTRTRQWRCKPLPVDHHGKPITRIGVGDLWGWAVVNPWPGEGRGLQSRYSGIGASTYAQGFFSHARSYRAGRRDRPWAPDKPFTVYWTNGPTVEGIRHGWHPIVRSGGLVGYLGGREGWGVAMSVVGPSDVGAAVCPAWGEFHAGGADLPAEPDDDGYSSLTFTHRLAGLPPEIQQHVRDHAAVLFADARCLAIRLDGEDFEDQPLPFAAPHRGLRFVGRGVTLTTERAHSGKQAIVTRGIKPQDLPKVNLHEEHPPACLDPNHKYRLECWVWVDGEDTEAFVIGANELEIQDAMMFLRPETIGKCRTPSVKTPGEWRKVSLELTAPAWGGLLALNFVALGPGKAYFDDLRVWKVEREGKRRP